MKKYNFDDLIHMHLFYYRDIEEVFTYEAIAYKVCNENLWVVYFDISYYDDLSNHQFSKYPFYDKYGYEILHVRAKDLDECEGNKLFTDWLINNSIV
ncbi:TPA: DUF3986 family protein [Bacillus anthracis]|nr:DUF3986 family protein [Bacillus anthracis]HDR4242153.1 DUF3986 family protein [Bacillus anthracis]